MTMLETFRDISGHIYIDGALRKGTGTDGCDAIDPATEAVNGRITFTSPVEVDEAVAVARRAQKIWNRMNGLARSEELHEVARRLREAMPKLAEAATREMGKPNKESANEVWWAASTFDYYAEIARHEAGRVAGPIVDGDFHVATKHPLGVVGIILPFNFPFVLFGWEASAALGAGNAVIMKPSELCSFSSLLLMECFDHLPTGLVQCIPGALETGKALVGHDGVDGIAFTGSVEGGRAVARTCADSFKRVLIEASGNDPFLVMPSAELEIATQAAVFASFANCGQVCTSAERLYIHDAIHDRFVDEVTQLASRLRIGNGLDKVDIGPMAAQRERDRFEEILARATAEGAKVALGGSRPAGFNQGFFHSPTILTDCTPDMEILNNESFGPVMPICRVSSFDEALDLANRSRFGLGSCIFTNDLGESMRAINELEAGMTWVNATALQDSDAGPFSGWKLSGTGSQLGSEGLDQFRRTKFNMVDHENKPADFWWFPYQDEEAYTG
ncbi:MAG: aldehyde dehydrogenase [Rhodospirillaceae bacterium]|nr:aldehyde dehydrogenase [Rhodospirillaceae bacterium]|tara:strand:- start:7331 stop:8839 length:1509 start_codon:yes stop_codon:yes gene_type:complete